MNYKLLYVLSVLGVLGGILMFAGDMFFYFEPVSGSGFDSLRIMSGRSIKQLIIGGMLGPISGIFYALGSLIFYFAFRSISNSLSKIISSSWMAMFIIGGAYHSIYPNYGFVGRLPVEFRNGQINYVSDLIGQLYSLTFILGLVSSLLLVYIILTRKTPFPKWIIFIIPTFLTLLNNVITPYVPYPLGAIVLGGWVNICFIIFFSVCAILFYRDYKKVD